MAETKIILTQTVANLGHAGDVVEVRPGYARNYLFPQGLAFKWTKGAAAQIEAMKRARQAKALATREDAVAAKAAIEGTVVEIAAKVSESVSSSAPCPLTRSPPPFPTRLRSARSPSRSRPSRPPANSPPPWPCTRKSPLPSPSRSSRSNRF